jgi:hypothetical protein
MRVMGNVVLFSLALIPIGAGMGILEYLLYDIDRIISRALAYGALTVMFGSSYASVVLLLGQLLGRSSSITVAAATLAVATAFRPARGRVQRAVDRRFNRSRYDATETMDAFGARLRREVDLDKLTAELLAVVQQTMQPTQVMLWLRSQGARIVRAPAMIGIVPGCPSLSDDAGVSRALARPLRRRPRGRP